jgi:lipopolysaccharide/colanic/teichoic acid biosynthesis glycosyltransferase
VWLSKARLRSYEHLEELHGLLPEPMFLRALCLERKRAERSRKLFVLMLLEARTPFQNGNEDKVLDETVTAIYSSIRETDLTGWYKENLALGVIFTELGTADMQSILRALRAKATAALESHLHGEVLNNIRISFHCFPEDSEDRGTGLPTRPEFYPDLVQRDEARKVSRVIKRAMDVGGSAMALIVLSPIFLAIAVAIRLSSPGPILFRQKRVGQYGVPFTFLKFRSMHSGTNAQVHEDFIKGFITGSVPSPSGTNGKVVYKITDDPRVTGVGRFLRRASLDELPQFLNVLRGEMSLVGPRPPIPYELEAYDIWHRRRLLEVKPGITGLWQVNGRSRLRFDEMVRLDLKYAKVWSLSLDVRILLQTPRAVFSREGAY